MIINLNDIGPEGEDFVLNRQTGELNSILEDIIADSDYLVEFTIRPLDQGFELKGKVKTEPPELCSLCGIDIKIKINKDFYELLIPKIENPGHGEHYSRVNHLTDLHDEAGFEVFECENSMFDAGQYIHEILGLQMPLKPVGECNEKGDCLVCGLNVETTNFGYNEELPVEKNNPFSSLKDIKLI